MRGKYKGNSTFRAKALRLGVSRQTSRRRTNFPTKELRSKRRISPCIFQVHHYQPFCYQWLLLPSDRALLARQHTNCCRALARQHTNLYTWCAYHVTAEFIAATISIYVILSSTDGPNLAVLILFFCSRGVVQQHGDYYKRTEI